MIMTALQSEARSIKHITDLLASLSPAEAPQTRSQTKRKRSPEPAPALALPMLKATPLTSLYLDGMDDEQLWAQLELRTKSVCDTLEFALEATGEDMPDEESDESSPKRPRFSDEELGEDETGEEGFEGMGEESMSDSEDDEDENSEEEAGESEEDLSDGADLGEGITELRDPSSEEDDEDSASPTTLFSKINSALKRADKPKGRQGHSELDDGFFSLADFNAETERAEARKVSRGKLGKGSEEDEDSEDEEGDDVDLFQPVDEHDLGAEDLDAEGT